MVGVLAIRPRKCRGGQRRIPDRQVALRWMYELRPATRNDCAFLHDLLVATTKDYVYQTWVWDDS